MGNYYPPFSLRIPEELIEKVKSIAMENKRSTNKELEYIIQVYVDNWERQNDKIYVQE